MTDSVAAYFSSRAPLYARVYDGSAGRLAAYWWRDMERCRAATRESLGQLPGRLVREVGCGTGHLARDLAEAGATVNAIDVSPSMVELARQHASESTAFARISVELGDFEDELDGVAKPADVLVAITVMEYSSDPLAWLLAMRRSASEVVVTFPIRDLRGTVVSRLRRVLYGRFTVRMFSRPEVARLLSDAGLMVVQDRVIGSTYWVRVARAEERQ